MSVIFILLIIAAYILVGALICINSSRINKVVLHKEEVILCTMFWPLFTTIGTVILVLEWFAETVQKISQRFTEDDTSVEIEK